MPSSMVVGRATDFERCRAADAENVKLAVLDQRQHVRERRTSLALHLALDQDPLTSGVPPR